MKQIKLRAACLTLAGFIPFCGGALMQGSVLNDGSVWAQIGAILLLPAGATFAALIWCGFDEHAKDDPS